MPGSFHNGERLHWIWNPAHDPAACRPSVASKDWTESRIL
jgi:hypothetical protein